MIQILLTDEYTQGISKFMMLTQRQPKVITGKLKRNYSTCMNNRNIKKKCVEPFERVYDGLHGLVSSWRNIRL